MLCNRSSLVAAGFALLASCTATNLRGAAPERKLLVAPPYTDASSGLTAPDIAILNFALQLECLESNFYAIVAGENLDPSLTKNGEGTRGPGTVTGTQTASDFSTKIRDLAVELFRNEKAHLTLLRQTLKVDGGACQNIALDKAVFQNVLTAAAIPELGAAAADFDPYKNDAHFLIGAFIFEDVGVTAYNGAAPLLANKNILTAAAAIHNTEGYHAGIVRSLLYSIKDTLFTEGSTVTVGAVVNGIAALRDSLDGTGASDAGITSGAAFVLGPFDTNAMVFARTVDQVTRIVTAGATGTGLFFPQGLNAVLQLNQPQPAL